MTDEEIKSIMYQMTGFKMKKEECITTYTSKCGRFEIRHHVPTPQYKRFKSSFFDYAIDGKVYKTKFRYYAALHKLPKQ